MTPDIVKEIIADQLVPHYLANRGKQYSSESAVELKGGASIVAQKITEFDYIRLLTSRGREVAYLPIDMVGKASLREVLGLLYLLENYGDVVDDIIDEAIGR